MPAKKKIKVTLRKGVRKKATPKVKKTEVKAVKPSKKAPSVKAVKMNLGSHVLTKAAKTNPYLIDKPVEGKKKRGRPTVVTQLVVGKLEEAFAYDATVEEACFYAGINKDTYYEFIKKEPEFTDRVEELREASILLARRTILKDVSTDSDKALKYLERKRKGEFSTRQEMAHSGEVVNKHVVSDDVKAAVQGVFSKVGGDA